MLKFVSFKNYKKQLRKNYKDGQNKQNSSINGVGKETFIC